MRNIAVGIIATVMALTSFAQTPQEKGLQSINRLTAEAHIGFLASDELHGREAGTSYGRIAGKYVESCLKSLGIQPWNGVSYMQSFDAYHRERQKRGRFTTNPDSIAVIKSEKAHQRMNLNNVIGMIKGKLDNEYVVIGAHYDHLGTDPLLEGDGIYNGADDNASGVAALLQIARAFLVSGVQPLRSVIFALWDGEEKGLLGSDYFVSNFPNKEQIKGYLNFDMIGRNNDETNPWQVVYFYTEAHPLFGKWLKDDIAKYHFNLKPDYRAWDKPVGGSDNSSFARKDIPIIWYHTDGHPDYHQPSDHVELINWDKTIEITKTAFLNLWNLANEKSY